MKALAIPALMLATAAMGQTVAPAALADTQLADPVQEASAKALMETLRCVVCQGQSIADSDATMAGDMRALVRQRIHAGETPASVKAWLIGRYGAYITYDPPLGAATWPLWVAPVVLIAFGLWIARGSFRRRR
jgi:cytochrome c-type biogenesis protein CcmH